MYNRPNNITLSDQNSDVLGSITGTNAQGQGKSSFPMNRDKEGVLREEKYILRNGNDIYFRVKFEC
jgi:hypothetical protein